MVTKKQIFVVLITLIVLALRVSAGNIHNTPSGAVEEISNTDICSEKCGFELTFNPTNTAILPFDLTFNNNGINSATITIDGKTIFELQSDYKPVNKTHKVNLCDEYQPTEDSPPICLKSHEKEVTDTVYIKEFSKSTQPFAFENGKSYVIKGTGIKSPLANLKWSLHLGNWTLDPLWESSWLANGSVALNSTSAINYTTGNLTANVSWNDYNSSFKYIYSWYKNQNSIAVLNLPFEGGSNSTFTKDYSQWSNNATVTGATWNSTGGHDGKGAYYCDKIDDYINFSDARLFNFTGERSVSVWFNAKSKLNYDNILSKDQDAAYNHGYGIYFGLNQAICFRVGSYSRNSACGSTIPLNTWMHVVGTFNNTAIKLYVNGTLINTTTYNATSTSNTSSGVLEICRGSQTNLYNFNGTVDDIQLYNYSLSPEQILALYQNKTDMVVSNELTAGDIWKTCVTPNDGTTDGTEKCSNNITINPPNTAPIITSLILNSTNPANNNTNQNLTAYVETSDIDGDVVKSIYNWYKNENSITLLNMPFEGGSNSVWTKDYALGNNGTVTGATWNATGGYDGKGAYSCDGVDDFINFSSASLFNFTGPRTVSALIKINNVFNYENIIAKENDAAYNSGYAIYFNVGQVLCFRVGDYSRNSACTQNLLSTGTWYHVVGTFNNSVVALYVNGKLNATKNYNATSTSNISSNTLEICRGYGDNTYNFNGTVDDVQIYNYSLSPAQVLASYQNKTNVIVSNELTAGDVWKTCVIPNDGKIDGIENRSNNITIYPLNSAPAITSLILNTTNTSSNNTNQNLTAYVNTSDINGDSVKPIYNWYKEGSSITLLNMPFEGGSNSTFTKDYAFGNNGIVTSATWNSTGGYDSEGDYEFDGLDDYINLSTNQILNITGNLSFSVWIKRNSVQPYSAIFAKTSSDAWGDGFALYASNTNTVRFWVGNYGNDANKTLTADTNWHHIAGTYNGTVIRLWVDGVEGTQRTSTANISSANHPFEIGRGFSDSNNFNGSIDEVQIFNFTLSPAQITALYSNKTNIMVSSELTSGNVWKTCVTPNDGALDGTETCSNNVTITSALVDVYDLSLIYTNSSHYSVLRFFMRNIANYSNLFNWSLYTGESRINSTMPTNLTAGENIFALIEHNYTSSGTKTLVANGTTANDKDSDMIIAAIG